MNTQTIKAVASAACVVIVGLFGALGFDLDATVVQNVIAVVAFVAALAWGIWHNHNFTQAAQDAQGILDAIKDGDYTEDTDEELFNGKGEE